jgi:hypothetical protein
MHTNENIQRVYNEKRKTPLESKVERIIITQYSYSIGSTGYEQGNSIHEATLRH